MWLRKMAQKKVKVHPLTGWVSLVGVGAFTFFGVLSPTFCVYRFGIVRFHAQHHRWHRTLWMPRCPACLTQCAPLPAALLHLLPPLCRYRFGIVRFYARRPRIHRSLWVPRFLDPWRPCTALDKALGGIVRLLRALFFFSYKEPIWQGAGLARPKNIYLLLCFIMFLQFFNTL